MLVFDDPGIRCIRICIIYRSIALEIIRIQNLSFKSDAVVFQISVTVIIITVNGAGVNNFFCKAIPMSFVFQIIGVQLHIDTLKHILNHGSISANRDSLVERIKIVGIKGKTDRQAADDEGRQFITGTTTLLLRVALDQFFIDIRANQRNSLLFQIPGIRDSCGNLLLFDFVLAASGVVTPHI